MKRRQIVITITTVFMSIALFSCSKSLGIYIDIKNQAIYSCSGGGLNKIRIENDSTEVTLEGTSSVIYFNKRNPVSRTSIYGDVVYDYILKLRPNCSYVITKFNGYDRGPIKVTFKTDNTGKVIIASDVNCN